MNRTRLVSTIIAMLIIAVSFSSCVYHARGPAYDYGYGGYGYRHRVPPPRTVVVVPAPPPRVVHRNRDSRRHYGRSNRDVNRRNYSHNQRSGRSRYWSGQVTNRGRGKYWFFPASLFTRWERQAYDIAEKNHFNQRGGVCMRRSLDICFNKVYGCHHFKQ